MAKTKGFQEEDMLRFVADERRRSIGFGTGDGGELIASREQALLYYRGVMNDVPAMANRSRAVSTDVAEAIDTVLPDLLDCFIGGDDVATFIPTGEKDEEQAQEETDYVNHVAYTENNGFLILHTAFKDALMMRTGLFHWYLEEVEEEDKYTGPPEVLYAQLQQSDMELTEDLDITDNGDGTITVCVPHARLAVKTKAWPPEDFTVALDTIALRDTHYCCARSRQRVQDLISNGIDPDKARALPPYALLDIITKQRDEAGEHNQLQAGGLDDLKIVEVREHYIRLAHDDGEICLYRVLTDMEERVCLEYREVDEVPFAAITPYLSSHRFYGESIADKLIQIQQIKTALLRMTLDSGYFALNQRMEVAVSRSNEFTIADLLRNEPSVPVRSATGDAVRPLSSGGLSFDTFSAMEYASTMGEARTGIVRNSQGLKPDTLHDTASGAMALMSNAQKRVRMIARTFAETGVKDWLIGIRNLLRSGYAEAAEEGKRLRPANIQIKSTWKTIDPTKWPERDGMSIQIGLGSSGKEHDMMVNNQALTMIQEIVALQGGVSGPIVTLNNIHNRLKAWSRSAGEKSPDLFWTDPAQMQQQAPAPPPPDPAIEKAKADVALAQSKAQADMQLAQAKAQSDAQLQAAQIQAQTEADTAKAQRDHDLAMAKLDAEMNLRRYQTDQELQLKRDELAAELDLRRQLGMAQVQVDHSLGMMDSAVSSSVHIGGDPG